MRKLSKKISMLMVLAMLVGLFSGVVSASAASAWSFGSSKYDVAVNGSINMESKEYADFDLLKDGAAPAGYTVAWASSDEDVVWVNAKTGQLRANKFGVAEDGDKAVISATFTNTATKKSATRSFTIVLGAAKADFTVEAADATIALGEEVKFAPVVKNADGKAVKFATHKSYNGYFLDGKAIANPWTPEEAGEYTVTIAQFAKKADVADLAKAVRKTDVKVTVTVDADFDAKATGVKEITVYGDFAKDATFTVKKDGAQKYSNTATIAENGKSAVLALGNRISKGVYTVTCGDAVAEFTAEDEKVASIVIAEDGRQAYTDSLKTTAYAHYDVFNQYGESIRRTCTVQWSSTASSTSNPTGNTSTGLVTIPSATTLVYGNPLVLTAVVTSYNNSALSTSASMTVGMEDSIDSINVKGIVLADSTELLDAIPAGFQGGNYYLVFECLNRDGYPMTLNATNAATDLSFVSTSPMLVRDIVKTNPVKTVFIDGVEYGMVQLVKANLDQLKQGGVAEINVTSAKTGKTTKALVKIGSEQILQEFRVIRPDNIISQKAPNNNNTTVVLDYEALDKDGNKITDFRALHRAVSFSDPRVVLVKNDDGSARLELRLDGTTNPSKDVDIPVVFSVIVNETGKSDNVTLYIKEARRAVAVSNFEGTNEILEGDDVKIHLRDFQGHTRDGWFNFIDQYETKIENNALFRTSNGTNLQVALKFIGVDVATASTATSELLISGHAGTKFVGTAPNVETYYLFDAFRGGHATLPDAEVTLKAENEVTPSTKDFVVEVSLYDPVKNEFVNGSDRKFNFKIVDLSKVVSFAVEARNGSMRYQDDRTGGDGFSGWGKFYENDTKTDFSVKGYLANGHKVDVPDNLGVAGSAVITYEINSYYAGVNLVSGAAAVVGAPLTFDASANINPVYTNNLGVVSDAFKDYSYTGTDGSKGGRTISATADAKIEVRDANLAPQYRDKVSTTVTVGNGPVQNTTLNVNEPWALQWYQKWVNKGSEAIIMAENGIITFEDLKGFIGDVTNNYGANQGNNNGVKLTITKLVESDKGLTMGSLIPDHVSETVSRTQRQNGFEADGVTPKMEDWTPMIIGAEIGDTFEVTYGHNPSDTKTEGWHANLTIKFTVGADRTAVYGINNQNVTWK